MSRRLQITRCRGESTARAASPILSGIDGRWGIGLLWTASRRNAPLARADQVRTVSDVLRSLTYNDQPVPAELPASIGRWLDEHGELPDWVDRDRLERGSTVVVEHGPQVCVALATASLVYCYAGYPGVKVLTFSRRLGHDADRRVGETAQFVLAVTARDRSTRVGGASERSRRSACYTPRSTIWSRAVAGTGR